MFYLQMALAIIFYAGGYTTAWQLGAKKIAVLEAQIAVANDHANELLAVHRQVIKAAEEKAATVSVQLETDYVQHTKAINGLKHTLAVTRLRDPNSRQNSSNTLSESSNPKKPNPATDTFDLSENLTRLLRSESYRADTVAIYAEECFKFVRNNCGVAQ